MCGKSKCIPIIFAFLFILNNCLAQEIKRKVKFHLEDDFLKSLTTYNWEDFNDKIDSIFKLIDIYDEIDSKEIYKKMGLGSHWNFLDVKDRTKDLNWKELQKKGDFNTFFKALNIDTLIVQAKNGKIASDPLFALFKSASDSIIQSNLNNFENLKECSDFHKNPKKYINVSCIEELIEAGKIDTSYFDFEVVRHCVDFNSIISNIDWECMMKFVDFQKVMPKLDYSKLFRVIDSLGISNFNDLINHFQSGHQIFGEMLPNDWSNDVLADSIKEMTPDLLMKTFRLTENNSFLKNMYNLNNPEVYDETISTLANAIVAFWGVTEASKRFIVLYKTKMDLHKYYSQNDYTNILRSYNLYKDILIYSSMDNTFDSLDLRDYGIVELIGENFEMDQLVTVVKDIGMILIQIGNFKEGMDNLFIAESMLKNNLNSLISQIPVEVLLDKTFTDSQVQDLIQKFDVDNSNFERIFFDLSNGNIPVPIKSVIKRGYYNEALNLCLLYKDLFLYPNLFGKHRQSFVPGNILIDKKISLNIVEGLYHVMAIIKKKQGSKNKIVENAPLALQKFEYEQRLLIIYNTIIAAYLNQQEYSLGLEYQQKSWELLQSLQNLNYIHWETVNAQDGEFNVLPIHISVIVNSARLLNSRGELQNTQRFLEEAIPYMQEVIENEKRSAIEQNKIIGLERNLFEIYNLLALSYLETMNTKKALEAMNSCYHLAEKFDKDYYWFSYYNTIGLITNVMGDPEKAVSFLEKAGIYAKRLNNTVFIYGVYSLLSTSFLGTKNYEKANMYSDLSLFEAVKSGSNAAIINANLVKGKVMYDRFEIDSAYHYLSKCINLLESEFRNGYRSNKSKQLNYNSNFNAFSGAISCALRLNKKEEAYRHVQQIKARTLMDLLVEGTLESAEIPDSLKSIKNKVVFELNALQNSKTEIQKVGSMMMGPQDSLLKELEIVEAKIRKSSKRYENLTNSTFPSMEKISKQLEKNEAFLDFFAGDSIYVFVITRDRFSVFTVEHGRMFLSEISSLVKLAENTSNSKNISRAAMKKVKLEMMEYSSDIYPKVFADIHHSGILDNIEELIISPDHEIYKLPFDMLLLHEDDWTVDSTVYLGEMYTIQYTPSASLFDSASSIKESNNRDNPKMLVLAKSNFKEYSNLRNLSFSSDSLITKFKTVDIIKDEQATSNYLNELDLSKYDYLHLSSHAVMNEVPELSYLALTNSQLSLFNMFDLDLDCKLAVLSACQTAKGKFQRGGGVMGFTRGLMYAGSESLVISLWPIEDKASQILFDEFWSLIESGYSPNISMRRAKQHLRSMDTKYDNPFYWAGFVLYGRG